MFDKLLPMTILISILFSYYIFVFEFCINNLIEKEHELKLSIIYLGIFNLNFIMVLWLFLLVIFKRHKKIEDDYKITSKMYKKWKLNNLIDEISINSIDEGLSSCLLDDDYFDLFNSIKLTDEQNDFIEEHLVKSNLNIVTRNTFGQVSICFKCSIIKPDRCYHCYKCGHCVLKRDHHCPWLNKCIGYSNQKYFILLLIYSLVLTVFIFFSTMNFFLNCWRSNFFKIEDQNFLVILFYCLNFLFMIFLVLLNINSMYLVVINSTSIEQTYPPRIRAKSKAINFSKSSFFDIGSAVANLQQILGSNWLLSILPIWTTYGDGQQFLYNEFI